jgi:hypothetical protein
MGPIRQRAVWSRCRSARDLSGGGKHFPIDAASPSWLRGTVLKWIQDGAAP